MSEEAPQKRRFRQVAHIEEALATFPDEHLDWRGMVESLLRVIDLQESEIIGFKAQPAAMMSSIDRTRKAVEQERAEVLRELEKATRIRQQTVRQQRKSRRRLIDREKALDIWWRVTRGETNIPTLAKAHDVSPETIRRVVARGRAAFRAGVGSGE